MENIIKIHKKPELKDPYLIAAWPGIGNIGLMAVNYLKNRLEAEEFAEIKSWPYFFPKSITIKNGILHNMDFPSHKFYYKKAEQDLILFLGEMQPKEEEEIYDIANHVLDVGIALGCKRVYTAGAAVAPIHHTLKPKVWAVPNNEKLINEVKGGENIILMSNMGERGGQGSISGLNGVLLGAAKRKGLDGICLLGEIPIYIAQFSIPYPMLYPNASKSILEALTPRLKVEIDLSRLNSFIARTETEIENLYRSLPQQIQEELDKLKYETYVKPTALEPITDEEKEKIIKEVEEFFKKGGKIND